MKNSPVISGESMDFCLLAEDPVTAWYRAMVEEGRLEKDEAQASLVELLQDYSTKLSTKLATDEEGVSYPSWFSKLLAAGKPQEEDAHAVGIYVHGGVGSGKSMLMDAFFLQTPVTKKVRVHFHAFMKRLHSEMKDKESDEDPLATIAGEISARYRLICFDEFHVSDIADAMILRRLLDILIEKGVHFVMTSNYAPSELYPNGLARDRFLPAIDLINSRFTVREVLSGQDFRLRQLSKGKAYYSPLGEQSDRQLRETFERLAQGIAVKPSVKVNGRRVSAIARTTGAVWFEFDELCASPRSQSDYLEIADRFSTVFVSNVPEMGEIGQDISRRFTLLIDVLYDMRIKFICSAAVPLDELYGDSEGGESGRTLSRLREMQSMEYWRAKTAGHEKLL